MTEGVPVAADAAPCRGAGWSLSPPAALPPDRSLDAGARVGHERPRELALCQVALTLTLRVRDFGEATGGGVTGLRDSEVTLRCCWPLNPGCRPRRPQVTPRSGPGPTRRAASISLGGLLSLVWWPSLPSGVGGTHTVVILNGWNEARSWGLLGLAWACGSRGSPVNTWKEPEGKAAGSGPGCAQPD